MFKSRGANMTPFQDEALCRAYIEISVDSVNGANQIVFQQPGISIAAKYHQQPGISIARTLCSFQS